MTRENPNPAAFFFDDGTFVNLERVNYVTHCKQRIYDADTGMYSDVAEKVMKLDIGEGVLDRPYDEVEFIAISNALRTYHSKF